MGNFPSNLFVDVSTLPNDAYGFIQLLFLGGVYASVLYNSSNMISDGSELLLLVKSVAGIVGSVVLPVLGAVPDGAIVLFSGLGPDAAEQLSVGVGALAGSTIMLLTIPWFLSVLAGRVDIDHKGVPTYREKKKLSGQASPLTHTGVMGDHSIPVKARVMLATCIPYFIIQGAAFKSNCGTKDDAGVCSSSGERTWAFVSLVFCVLSFIGYLIWQVRSSNLVADALAQKQLESAIRDGRASITALFRQFLEQETGTASGLLAEEKSIKTLNTILRKFFNKYDTSGDGRMQDGELRVLLQDMGESKTDAQFRAFRATIRSTLPNEITFEEFSQAMVDMMTSREAHTPRLTSAPSVHDSPIEAIAKAEAGDEAAHVEVEGEDDDEEEEEDVPEDLAGLSPEQQLRRIKIRACWMMGVGTLITLLFSDPMVDVLNELGNRTHIPPFFVAFVLAPLASNASEMLASYSYAQKKTSKTVSIAFSTLEGAAIMNNTFCLGIFLALIAFNHSLSWSFSAETIAIVFVQLVMFFLANKRVHRLLDGLFIISLYPLSLALVAILENVIGLD